MINYQEYEEHICLIMQKMLKSKDTINLENFHLKLDEFKKEEKEKNKDKKNQTPNFNRIKKDFLLLLNKDKSLAADIAISGYYLAHSNWEKKIISIRIDNNRDILEQHKNLSFLKNETIKNSVDFLNEISKKNIEHLFHTQILIKELIMLKNYAEIFKLKFEIKDENEQK